MGTRIKKKSDKFAYISAQRKFSLAMLIFVVHVQCTVPNCRQKGCLAWIKSILFVAGVQLCAPDCVLLSPALPDSPSSTCCS